MIRSPFKTCCNSGSLPRMRGDDPGMFERGVTVWEFAPHARG